MLSSPRLAIRPMLSFGAIVATVAFGAIVPVASAAPGALDPGFGLGGTFQTNVAGSDTDEAEALAVLPSGAILVAGDADENQGQDDIGMFQVDTNGVLDPSFGSGGRF